MEQNNKAFTLDNIKYLCSASYGGVWFSNLEIDTLFQMMDDKMHEIIKKDPYFRKGQVIFLIAHNVFKYQLIGEMPECIDKPNPEDDCFSVDARIPNFLRVLRFQLFKKNYRLKDFKKSELL